MAFDIQDSVSFDDNLAAFVQSLEADDPKLAAVLKQKLPALLQGATEPSEIWNALEAAAQEPLP